MHRMSITAASLNHTSQPCRSISAGRSISGYTALSGYTVVLPTHLAGPQPTAEVYVRRRLLVGVVLVAVVVAVWFGAGSVLANRGGAPASTAAARQAVTYTVQPGDTLWSIAAARLGGAASSSYVDLLVERNGSATIQVGQVITLP
jgi:LysM repeat protein